MYRFELKPNDSNSNRNKRELELLFEELIFLPKETAEEVVRYVFKDPHDFMFGITDTGTLHRNFNELRMGGDGAEEAEDGEDDEIEGV